MNLANESIDLTLIESIEKLRSQYSGLIQGENKKAESWFLNHDATHVIFNTPPFELKGEIYNDMWTIFGSNVSFKQYSEFFEYTTSKKAFSPYLKKFGGIFNFCIACLKLTPGCIQVYQHSRKMTKKWPWHVSEKILQQKVSELRKEYNIKLVE